MAKKIFFRVLISLIPVGRSEEGKIILALSPSQFKRVALRQKDVLINDKELRTFIRP